MVMEDKSKGIRKQMRKCRIMEEFEEKIFKLQQLEFKELSGIGRYTGNFLKPLVDFFEKDCSKVENYYHIYGKKDNDNEVCITRRFTKL